MDGPDVRELYTRFQQQHHLEGLSGGLASASAGSGIASASGIGTGTGTTTGAGIASGENFAISGSRPGPDLTSAGSIPRKATVSSLGIDFVTQPVLAQSDSQPQLGKDANMAQSTIVTHPLSTPGFPSPMPTANTTSSANANANYPFASMGSAAYLFPSSSTFSTQHPYAPSTSTNPTPTPNPTSHHSHPHYHAHSYSHSHSHPHPHPPPHARPHPYASALAQRPGFASGSTSTSAGSSARPSLNPYISQAKHHSFEDVKGESSGHETDTALAKGASGRAGNRRRQKYTRTRTGCLCCRARRIKCDEGRPVCKRCVIAKKTCEYPAAEDMPRRSRLPRNKGTNTSSPDDGQSDDSEDEHKGESRSKQEDGPPRTQTGAKDDSGPSNHSSVASSTSADLLNHGHAPGVGGCLGAGYEAKTEVGGGNDNNNIASLLDLGSNLTANGFNWESGTLGTGIYDSLATTFDSLTRGENGSTAQEVNDSTIESSGGMVEKQQRWGMSDGTPMFATPNFLLPWFPTAEERSLILHYCANAADLMMAIPSGLNPMLAINLPLALDSPRGVNPSADALRVALLGIGAIHQAFLLARSGSSTVQTTAMFQYASNLRDTGKEMVRRAVRDKAGGTTGVPGAKTDAALGASTALATIDIFFGGGGWQANFDAAKEMVALRGGPAEMLKLSKPTQLAEGVTMSPARMMLEILAIYETFGCLTLGQEPTLISDKWESWWFDSGSSSYEEHSVEKQFGMSRVMVHLFARLTRLIARVKKQNKSITEADLPSNDPATNSALSSLLNFSLDPIEIEARQLNSDVNAWIDSLQLATLEHERVQVGNRAYAFAMKILLLRMVFQYSREDARVQDAAIQVMTHCSTSTALLGMSIDLTWPAIIAGCCVDGQEKRQWVLTLLEGFKSQCCFDIETASRIITEVWRRVDAGESGTDWKPVCDDLGLDVL